MIEFFHCSKHDIKTGNFPLNHDCILKVRYISPSIMNNSYLSCRSCDSGSLVAIISSLPVVKDVKISSVDSSDDIIF